MRYCFLSLFCLLTLFTAAQRLPDLIPYRAANNLWGYVDSTLQVKIPPKFLQASLFRNSIAIVCDTLGIYDCINLRGEGLVAGKKVNEAYDIFDLDEGFVLVYGMDTTSKKPVSYLVDSTGYICKLVKQISFIDADPHHYTYSREYLLSPFRDGLMPAGRYLHSPVDEGSNDRRCGFIDHHGRWAVRPVYTDVFPFREERAIALRGDVLYVIDKKGKQYARINDHDMILFSGGSDSSPQVDPVCFSEGLFPVRLKNNKYVIVTRDGKLLPVDSCIDIQPFHHGRALATDSRGLYNYIGRDGKFVSADRFKLLEPWDSVSAIAQDQKGNWFLVDSNARTVFSFAGKNYSPYYKMYDIRDYWFVPHYWYGATYADNFFCVTIAGGGSSIGGICNRKGELQEMPKTISRALTGTAFKMSLTTGNVIALTDAAGKILYPLSWETRIYQTLSDGPLLYTEDGYIDIHGTKYWEKDIQH